MCIFDTIQKYMDGQEAIISALKFSELNMKIFYIF